MPLLDYLRADSRLRSVSYKESYTDTPPFLRFSSVKLKREIVTMGVEGIDRNLSVGTYSTQDWNQLNQVTIPVAVLLSSRMITNPQVGTFKNDGNTRTQKSFVNFREYVKSHLEVHKTLKMVAHVLAPVVSACEKYHCLSERQGGF